MMKISLILLLATATAFGQYTAEPAGPPPSDLSPEMVAELLPAGHKISGAGKVYAELWFRKSSVDGPDTGEIDVSWSTAPHGAFIGAIRFPEQAQDRRGQTIKPGVYTLRFSYYPIDGAHQGLEPSRDFLVMSPAAIDKDPTALPSFDELMDMSRKASGGPHPLVLACWKAEDDWQEGLSQLENDWVLGVKIGETPIMVLVKGVNPHG